MSNFNSWEEVKDWLEDPEDNYQTVTYHNWTFSKSYMSCNEPNCCDDSFQSVDDAVESIKQYSGNKIGRVNRDD